MQKFSEQDLKRIRQAVSYHSMALRRQDSPSTISVEHELSNISNILQDAIKEVEDRGYVTIEVKK